ncbi:hypothetical protein STENM36S_01601 [Streptomyces tendae]
MDNWRKSSYSGEGDGNNCVEIATRPAHVAVRDSKAPPEPLSPSPARRLHALPHDGGGPGGIYRRPR